MAYLLLYGPGWTQRWQIDDRHVDSVREAINHVGREGTGQVQILDPGSGEPTTLAVAWRHVAAAVVLGADHAPADDPEAVRSSQYP